MTTPAAAKVPHIERQPRRADGRVVSTYSNGQLYRIVKEAALALNPESPETLSVRQFDRTVASLGYTDAPSARAICGRLKRGWREIVDLALSRKPSGKKIDVPQMSDEAKWLTERQVFFALNAIARFKNVETMTAHDYDHYLAEFLAARRQPAHILGRNARFPTSSQIERLAEDFESKHEMKAWEKALVYAGLQPVKTVTANALSVVEAINLYIEASGCEFYPSSKELPRLREEFGISIREREAGRKWEELMKEALDGRAAAGLPVPTVLAGDLDEGEARPPSGLHRRRSAPRSQGNMGYQVR